MPTWHRGHDDPRSDCMVSADRSKPPVGRESLLFSGSDDSSEPGRSLGTAETGRAAKTVKVEMEGVMRVESGITMYKANL